MSDLARLARPFPPNLVKQPPKGKYGHYVSHDVVNQKLLAIVGPFTFGIREIVRGPDGRVEGCLAELTATVDGRQVTITEVGDCENPDNWKTEGARLKDASSDALKRCAMRLGCGLHLWSGQDYFLDQQLKLAEEKNAGAGGTVEDPVRPSPARAVPTAVERSVDTPPLPLGAT